MNIHEYQAKTIFGKYGIPIPKGQVASSLAEAEKLYSGFGTPNVVVKAQIHGGGRGKAGGIKIVNSLSELRSATSILIGKKLVTYQTGSQGRPISKILLEEVLTPSREMYLSLAIDRKNECLVMIASPAGGVEIETLAKEQPDKLLKEQIHPFVGLTSFQLRKISTFLEISQELKNSMHQIATALVKLFWENQCSLVEINPLGIIPQRGLVAMDAKIVFDDRGTVKAPSLEEMFDVSQEDQNELEAKSHGLSYVSMDGNIGCLVNGAGLAMSTMDIIKLHGGEPANFLDVGGGASKEQVIEAFKILFINQNIKAILVNIFGGIMKCDIIAQGLIEAAKILKPKVPIIIRLEGTNVDIARRLLQSCDLPLTIAIDMTDAAKKVVECAKSV
jgi:succinyl-CoA synthetase beta subunit